MSGLFSASKDRCTLKHPFTPSDLKNLARFMFGANRYHNQELGRFCSCLGPLTINHDGQNGAVWRVGSKQFATASEFREIMLALPLKNKHFNGDMYLSANVLGEKQFLVLRFQCDDLLWFRSEAELLKYYRETSYMPDVERFVMRPWAWQSVSA